MSRRNMIPISFGGTGLTTTGRRAHFEYDEGAYHTPDRSSVSLNRVGRFPSHVRVQPQGKMFPLRMIITSKDSERQFREISRIFNPDDGLQLFVVDDECDVRRRVLCVPQRIILDVDNDKSLVIPLWAPSGVLEADVATTVASGILTATPGDTITFSLRNEGSHEALPTFVATATQQKVPAEGHRYVYEVAYANRSEFSLTGPGSGTWLLQIAPPTFDTVAEIAAGRMLATGDDIVVFVDGVEVDPAKVRLNNMNTTDTEVWIEIADGPSKNALLQTAIVAGTLVFDFPEDHPFQEGDYLVWDNDATTTEQARVISVDGDQVTVTRGLRNTTAGASAIGIRIYRSSHHIQLAHGFTGAATRPPDPNPPLIDLDISTNLQWEWPLGPMTPDNNRRPGGWRRIIYEGREDVPELRKNKLSAFTALDLDGSTFVRFADVNPTAARPNFDAIEFQACCGIDDVLGAIEYDAELDWPFAFQIIGRDLLGLDHIVFSRLGHESGAGHFPPRLYNNQQETPESILSAVIFRARQMVLTTARPTDTMEEGLEPVLTIGHDLQGFRIEEQATIIGLVARMRDLSGTPGQSVQVNEVSGGDIFIGGTPGLQAPGAAIIGPFGGSGILGAAFRPVCSFPTPQALFTTDIPVIVPGNYFLSIAKIGAPGASNSPVSDSSIYPHGDHWEYDGDVYVRVPTEDLWFAILSLTADNQQDAVDANRTNEELLINDVTLIFDPDRTPIVTPAAREDAYYYDTTWILDSDNFRLRYLKRSADALTNSITVNVADRTVVDDQNGDNIRATVIAAGDPWLPLVPGPNAVLVNAVNGATEEDHSATFRSTWQA